jgi:hypothetical protein
MLEILRQEYGRHPTPSELALERVDAGQRGMQAIEEFGHAPDPEKTDDATRDPRET